MIRCDTRTPRWSDLASALLTRHTPSLWDDPAHVPTHSGKSGLNHVFSYLRASKILENKNSKILAPPWLGYWVYNAMRPHGCPVLHDDPEVKVVLVYHQYGFPQDLDEIKDYCSRRRLVFIEDCAHALGGTYKGRPLGSDGLAAIFSFSKFCPSLISGAVRSNDVALRAHVGRLENCGSHLLGLFSFGVKFATQYSALTAKETSIARRLNEFSYAGYPYCHRLRWSANLCSIRDELDHRRRLYGLYRELLPGHEDLQRLEADAVPYVVPLMHPRREVLERTAVALREFGLDTGVYAFDANRNVFNPNYVPSLWLPVHSGITRDTVERIVEIVKRLL